MSIRKQYDTDLESLKNSLTEMGRNSADAVENALEALCVADADAAAAIVKGDARINNMERDIEHRCMTLLLRQQPVAGDLRRISTAMKVVTDIERIGDHAADIAEIIPHLVTVRKEGDPAVSQAIAMGKKAHQMILDALDALTAEDENCLSWLFGSKDKITMPYLNIKGQGLKRNVTLDLEDCLVGITYTELGSIGSFVSASAAQQAWKAQAVAVHSYLEYHKQYGSSTNALIYTPVDQIPASARNAIRKAVQAVKDEVLVYNGSVCDAVWSASAGYNTQTGVYGTCSSRDAWGTDVPYLQSVESPYEEQYHKLLRRVIGKDYTYIEYNDSRTGEPYQSADTTHKDLGGFVQYNTLVSNGRSYRYINQFVSSRYCFDFGTDASGTPCMTYYGYGHGVGMSQCGAVGYAAEEGMNYKQILQHYYTGAKIRTSTTRSGGLFGWLAGLFR